MKSAKSGDEQAESLEGHVVDIACVRKYPRAELAGRAREHTRRLLRAVRGVGYVITDDDT